MKSEFVPPTENHIAIHKYSATSLRVRGLISFLIMLVLAALSTSAQAQTLTPLYDFTGADGSFPTAGVTRDPAGNLYGTTYSGGAYGYGVVFKLAPNSGGPWTESVLYSFAGGTDGANPYAGVTRDSAGNLYGTTLAGGSPTCQCGTVFKVSSSGQETVLYRFRGGTDGASPYAGVARDSAGNLYGTTSSGGHNNNGTVFKLNASAKESVLYRFRGEPDGSQPLGVIRDSVGNLYGATMGGGSTNAGVVFKLDVNNQETVLNDFSSVPNAATPSTDLSFCGGGADVCGAVFNGVIYQVNRRTGNITVLGSNGESYNNGLIPEGGVVEDAAGNVYGTMSCCGQDFGTIFKINTKGRYSVVYNFAGYADGGYPQGDLIMDPAGNLYGTASSFADVSNTCQCGAVYEFKP